MRKEESKNTGWDFGPPIHATFYTDAGWVMRITLKMASQFSCSIHGDPLGILEWMEGYRLGKCLPLPLNLSSLSPFAKQGLLAIQAIPFGEVRSYREIAERAGCAKGARAIGNVCNKNPFPLVIPCHRVISSNGSLGGFAYPFQMKESLIEFETQKSLVPSER
ncbi:MAG: MGMT family protein [Chlamydiia bacterium]|nr:MGMT family protein [Chlamydiia bacterium]